MQSAAPPLAGGKLLARPQVRNRDPAHHGGTARFKGTEPYNPLTRLAPFYMRTRIKANNLTNAAVMLGDRVGGGH